MSFRFLYRCRACSEIFADPVICPSAATARLILAEPKEQQP